MVQGLKFLSKKSFHPQNKSNQKRVWEHEQSAQQQDEQWKARQRQLERERHDEDMASLRGETTKVNFLYQPPPGMAPEKKKVSNDNENKRKPPTTGTNSLFERQPGDDDAAAEFRKLLAGGIPRAEDELSTSLEQQRQQQSAAPIFGTVMQGSGTDEVVNHSANAHSGNTAPTQALSALEKSVGRKHHKGGAVTLEEQVQRFPALKNAPRVRGLTGSDVGVNFQPLGTQIRNVRCLACGIWGHSRGERECPRTGWDPFAAATVGITKEQPKSDSNAVGDSKHSSASAKPESSRKRSYSSDSDSSSDESSSSRRERRKKTKKHRKSRHRHKDDRKHSKKSKKSRRKEHRRR